MMKDPFSNTRYYDFVISADDSVHVQDFSWENQAYSLIKDYLPILADLTDAEFTCIRNLTYKTFGSAEVKDTAPFRLAIWYYVHRIQGIFHDDYDYRNVNNFISQDVKRFVKKSACTPFAISVSDLYNMGIKLQPSEKAHIVLLVAESRKQAELIYALQGITQWTSQRRAQQF